MINLDRKTEEVATSLIAMFDEAVEKGDLVEMERIVDIATSSPNQPLQQALLRHLEAV